MDIPFARDPRDSVAYVSTVMRVLGLRQDAAQASTAKPGRAQGSGIARGLPRRDSVLDCDSPLPLWIGNWQS